MASTLQCRTFTMDASCSDVCFTCRRPEVEHSWLVASRRSSRRPSEGTAAKVTWAPLPLHSPHRRRRASSSSSAIAQNRQQNRVIGRREARLQQQFHQVHDCASSFSNLKVRPLVHRPLSRTHSHRASLPSLRLPARRLAASKFIKSSNSGHKQRQTATNSHHLSSCCPANAYIPNDNEHSLTTTDEHSSTSSDSSLSPPESCNSLDHQLPSLRHSREKLLINPCNCCLSTEAGSSTTEESVGQQEEEGENTNRRRKMVNPKGRNILATIAAGKVRLRQMKPTQGILKTALPAPPISRKMGLLKSPSNPANPGKCKRGITFAENGPEIIGYRDASDSEDDEEFFELSLKSSASPGEGDSTEKQQPSSPEIAYDDEADPERIKLRKLTETNTLFNSNYANFKLNDSGTGLGRAKPPGNESGPIKFVIQDGYQQPLPPTKYKSNANLKKRVEFTGKASCDTSKTSPSTTILPSKPTPSKPTCAPPPKPSNPSFAKVKAPEKSTVVPPLSETPTATESKSIPTIRIPRASIVADKANRSPPPVPLSTGPVFPGVEKPVVSGLEKPVLTQEKPPVKPEKPPKLITASKLAQAPVVQLKAPDLSVASPPSVLREHRNSVILLDDTDGTILPLDSHKLPAELKNEDVVEQGQLFLVEKKEAEDRARKERKREKDSLDCLSDSGSDSGASGCSPSSASPTAQLLDEGAHSTSPSPDSLDSNPDSYDLMKSESGESDLSNGASPVPPAAALSPPPVEAFQAPIPSVVIPKASLSSSSKLASTTGAPSSESVKPETTQMTVDETSPSQSTLLSNLNNKTMISISYRRSSSQASSESVGTEAKRNAMLQKLAMDLEKHRDSSSGSNISADGSSVGSSSVSLSSTTNRPELPPPPPPHAPSVPKSPMEQFIADCCADGTDDDELTNAQAKALFSTSTDSETDSDSECEPLPDQIKSDAELEESDSELSDTEVDHRFGSSNRRESKESVSKSSTSSLGSKSKSSNDKSVSSMFKSVVNNSNTKKYTKLMRKNISKTSKFIVNTTKHLGNETTDMVKKLKDKSKNSEAFYYPEEYTESSHKSGKSSSNSFYPNAIILEESSEETLGKKKKKFEVYNLAKSAFKNIEGKIKASGGSKSQLPAQTEMPVDPFGCSGASGETGEDGVAMLKTIKRLDSLQQEPSYSEPNLLLISAQMNASRGAKSESTLSQKPLLPPRNYRVAPGLPAEEPPTPPPTLQAPRPPLPEAPPQAPLRRKKLAKRRELASPSVEPEKSSIEMLLPSNSIPEEVLVTQSNIPVKALAVSLPEMSLYQLKCDYEKYFNVFESQVSSVEILEELNPVAKTYSVYRCKAENAQEFILLNSKILWTTVYDSDTALPADRTFQGEFARYLPASFTRFYDVPTFCKSILHNSDSCILQPEMTSRLVDSLVLQLYSILAQFEAHAHSRTIGDVNDSLIALTGDPTAPGTDVLLLLPTKQLDSSETGSVGDDEGLSSLSMMQSFCLQVFLIRLTGLLTNEDVEASSGLKRSGRHAHYRNLVRRNQSGVSSQQDLYLLASLDIHGVLPGPRKSLSPEQVKGNISSWFTSQQSAEAVRLHYQNGGQFTPESSFHYGETLFALKEAKNEQAAIAIALRELKEQNA